MAARAEPAGEVGALQDDVDRRLRLAIRDDQVHPQARFPRILAVDLELVKSTEILQSADLGNSESPVNSGFREVELQIFPVPLDR